ncbi:MAG: fructose-1,6-bisphosphatase [bacterium]|nr:fructose-1,6-bisphosphatase [Candidatus Minthenecus merdequi]
MDIRFLELLGRQFPTIEAASTEIINLEAILNLPKGTEHFLSDVHGEYEAFDHVLRNASGSVARKVNDEFGTELREKEKHDLCTLIYYPAERLEIIKVEEKDNIGEWYRVTLPRLVRVLKAVSSKYTRSKTRKALPKEFSYIIEELMNESGNDEHKHAYVEAIFESIINNGRSDAFIVAMCNVIQRLVIDRLHLVGDIYDRGPGAHLIMDKLLQYRDIDIQWGNHDVVWMGAAAGNDACMCNVLRISLRYANLITLEDGYGINMLPLATFAQANYANDSCLPYMPKLKYADINYDEANVRLIAQMHKAIAVIQWKIEHDIIARHPEWGMESRDLLHKIDREKGTVEIGGKWYELKDADFPTVDPQNPYELTEGERDVLTKLHNSFVGSAKMAQHLRLMLDKGMLYLVCNGNLLFHASIPLNDKGEFKEVELLGKKLKGKALCDEVDRLVRVACLPCKELPEYETALDYMWYWWCGPDSPSFDKHQMATFERYLIEDKEPHAEHKGYFYKFRDDEKVCDMMLDEFGVIGTHRHIINGHVPVKTTKGESPIRSNGKVLVIDGGFSRAYHSETGIAGYTLVSNSHTMQLVQHEAFESRKKAIEEGIDLQGTHFVVETDQKRTYVRDTDNGRRLQQQVDELKELMKYYNLKYAYQEK